MFDWEQARETHLAEQARSDEEERRTMADLLRARGHAAEALLVATSEYRSDCVDNWNGGQYEVLLSVPPHLYDQVTAEMRERLTSAAAAVIEEEHFRGLRIAVRRSPYEPGWDAELIKQLVGERQPTTPPSLALPPGSD